MSGLAWTDVGIMAIGCILLVALLALVETASQALKRRRHAREARAREARHRRHVCGVCHTTGCPHSVMTRCLLCGAPGSKHDVPLQ